MEKLSPQLREQLVQSQHVQQQLQAIATQRIQLEMQMREVERAIAELDKLEEKAEVYKSIGSIFIKSEKTSVKAELQEGNEAFDVRLKTLQRQEKKLREKLEEMQAKIKAEIEAHGSYSQAT